MAADIELYDLESLEPGHRASVIGPDSETPIPGVYVELSADGKRLVFSYATKQGYVTFNEIETDSDTLDSLQIANPRLVKDLEKQYKDNPAGAYDALGQVLTASEEGAIENDRGYGQTLPINFHDIDTEGGLSALQDQDLAKDDVRLSEALENGVRAVRLIPAGPLSGVKNTVVNVAQATQILVKMEESGQLQLVDDVLSDLTGKEISLRGALRGVASKAANFFTRLLPDTGDDNEQGEDIAPGDEPPVVNADTNTGVTAHDLSEGDNRQAETTRRRNVAEEAHDTSMEMDEDLAALTGAQDFTRGELSTLNPEVDGDAVVTEINRRR